MEVIALKTCKWTVKGKLYELEEGKKYKFPATLKAYVEASKMFKIIKSEE